MLFSIIVPVYNVENYLCECIDSILSQTYLDFELILVDDGSQDSSPIICDNYATKDSRVSVIHQKNSGLSNARNVGISKATGEYLLFIDSDDFWRDNNVLAIIYDNIQKTHCDVLQFSATLLFPDKTTKDEQFNEGYNNVLNLSGKQQLELLIKNNLIIGSACSKAIRTTFLKKNNLFFKSGIKSEDIEWILRLCAAMPSYTYIPECIYVYRKQRKDSITSTIDYRHLCDYEHIITKAYESFKDDDTKSILINYISYHYLILCAHSYGLNNKNEKKEIKSRLKKLTFLFDYTLNKKVKLVALIYKLFGFNFVYFILGKYILHR